MKSRHYPSESPNTKMRNASVLYDDDYDDPSLIKGYLPSAIGYSGQ